MAINFLLLSLGMQCNLVTSSYRTLHSVPAYPIVVSMTMWLSILRRYANPSQTPAATATATISVEAIKLVDVVQPLVYITRRL
ncbi:hypothetical protein BDV28DRAFT_139782 [Aspergillus coremiiformis]|uniref:Secreted protein n=1 Tax=Aspergillus coremiiformis TaxID=138285 RepID=A0A5N6YXF1_9EURO|nr:hypothetical protein BDV28DRAFT_139782 [Aspergillus coremiiformis]